MSLDEITARIREKKNRMGYCYEYLGAQVLKSGDTVRRMALHQDGTLYTMLDMLDELKLELRLNDEIIQSHQDILEFLKRHKIEADNVAKRCSVEPIHIKKLCKGENIRADKFMDIMQGIGVEARAI